MAIYLSDLRKRVNLSVFKITNDGIYAKKIEKFVKLLLTKIKGNDIFNIVTRKHY